MSFLKRRWTLFCVVATVGFAALSAVDPGGLRKRLRLEAEVRRTEAANLELRHENLRLRREARALAGEPAALERAAREELGYVRPGEIVFQLDDRDSKP
jgi:cell division protein FtsB